MEKHKKKYLFSAFVIFILTVLASFFYVDIISKKWFVFVFCNIISSLFILYARIFAYNKADIVAEDIGSQYYIKHNNYTDKFIFKNNEYNLDTHKKTIIFLFLFFLGFFYLMRNMELVFPYEFSIALALLSLPLLSLFHNFKNDNNFILVGNHGYLIGENCNGNIKETQKIIFSGIRNLYEESNQLVWISENGDMTISKIIDNKTREEIIESWTEYILNVKYVKSLLVSGVVSLIVKDLEKTTSESTYLFTGDGLNCKIGLMNFNYGFKNEEVFLSENSIILPREKNILFDNIGDKRAVLWLIQFCINNIHDWRDKLKERFKYES